MSQSDERGRERRRGHEVGSVRGVKIDGMLGGSFDEIEDRARALETDGYDGGATAETSHDPFFPLLLAARATERLELVHRGRDRLRRARR